MMGPVSASSEATVTRYLASACALSWLAWLPATRRRGQGAPATLSALVGTTGPTAAAFLAVRRRPRDRAALADRIRRWRAPGHAYAAALLVPPAVAEAAARLASRRLGVPSRARPSTLAGTLAFAGTAGLLGGPLGEEPGWRGYALPQLEERLGHRRAALVLGAVWGVWHVPLLLTIPEQRFGMGVRAYLPAFLVSTVGHSAFQTWLATASRGSVPVAVLGHSAYNAATLVLVAEGHPGLLDRPEVAEGAVRVFAGAWAVVGGLALIALPPRREEPRP